MYKVRTCRIAIRSVCTTSVTFRDHFPSPPRPAANAVPDTLRCALCARWAGPRYN